MIDLCACRRNRAGTAGPGLTLAVDDQVGRIVRQVRKAGEMKNTCFIFNSDNGCLQGEHRLRGSKFLPYENSIRIPTLVSGPRVKKGRAKTGNAIDVDLAPTSICPSTG